MKSVPSGLAASLASGITMLCRCWIVTRRDDVAIGCTDHDEDVIVDGVTCAAATGFSPSAIEQSLDLSVDDLSAMGALVSDRLDESELARGLFDNASLDVWLVDWTSPSNRVRLFAGSIGEVTRGRTAFRAECRSLSHALNQPRGRSYTRTCDAAFGDARCGKDATSAAHRGTGTVTAVAAQRVVTASGLGSFADGWFSRGRLVWTAGANAGAVVEVRAHAVSTGGVSLELWEIPPSPIETGDTFTVDAGCDKSFSACRAKFDNAVNFRGFPHMPGNDFVTSVASQGDGNDGGSLY